MRRSVARVAVPPRGAVASGGLRGRTRGGSRPARERERELAEGLDLRGRARRQRRAKGEERPGVVGLLGVNPPVRKKLAGSRMMS